MRGTLFAELRRCILPGVALLAATPVAAADPLPADDLPQSVLEECDRRAMPYGAYARTVAAAVADLTGLGVFAESEFRNVKIGFCDLRALQGPAATVSCAQDTILLDSGYAAEGRALALTATLAHEMKHYLQHGKQKEAFGEGYCDSERYRTDRVWMEEEADAFGDEVAALLVAGRPVEIRNACPVSVSVYLEPDSPLPAGGGARGFMEIAAQSVATSPERSGSKSFTLYAVSEPHNGRKWVWRAPTMTHRRLVDGKAYPARRIALSNPSRSTGPFRLRLSCPADTDH